MRLTSASDRWPRFVAAAGLLLLVVGCGGGSEVTSPEAGEIAGVVAADEGGVAGAVITLAAAGSRTTNSQGEFRFGSVDAGQHTLEITPPDGFELAPGEPQTRSVTVASGQTALANWSVRPTAPGNGGETEVVEIRLTAGNQFVPDDVTIDAGTTVRWVNDANILHTVTPDDPDQSGAWASATSSTAGVVLEHTFGAAGETYDYHCEPHRSVGMTGRIVVQ